MPSLHSDTHVKKFLHFLNSLLYVQLVVTVMSRKLSGWVDEDDYYDDYDDDYDEDEYYDEDYYEEDEGSGACGKQHDAVTVSEKKKEKQTTKATTKASKLHLDGQSSSVTSLERKMASTLALTSDVGEDDVISYKPTAQEKKAYENTGKLDLSVVILGHVDAGKSTLCGRLLEALHSLDARTHHKNARDSKAAGKASFAYAWAMDSLPEERARGVTIDVARARVRLDECEDRWIQINDAPGHRDFVPSAIAGASSADVALLVVDGAIGAFEKGFSENGQTKEHAIMAKALGVSKIIVVVNKLDSCAYDEVRFEEVKRQILNFLTSGTIGYDEKDIAIVPVSALEGSNIVSSTQFITECAPWYKGKESLLDALKNAKASPKGKPAPLRMPVLEILSGTASSHALGNCAFSGKIESGSISVRDKVFISPANVVATVKRIEKGLNQPVQFASVGEVVDIGLTGVETSSLQSGSVICHHRYPLRAVKAIEVDVKTSDVLKRPILPGAKVVVHAHAAETEATVSTLVNILDESTGDEVKRKPLFLPKSKYGKLILSLEQGICVESYALSRTLGSLLLRSEGETIARGTIAKTER